MTQKQKRIKKHLSLISVFMALALLTAALLLSSCSQKLESETNYIKVSQNGEKLEMKVTLTETGLDTVYLFALESWQSPSDIIDMTPIAECKVKDDVAQLTHKVSGSLTAAICRGYVLGKLENSGYKAVSGTYYVANPRDLHKSKPAENLPLSNIKGAIGTPSQLLDLGADSTVVTVELSELMSAEGGIGRLQFVRNGYTCYIDRDAVERLDKEIKGYTDAGIYVFLELVQSKSYDELPEGLKCIAFPGATGALGYALNMTDREGATKICGIFDFLAQRYGNGGEHGKAEAFIIGRSVNNYTKYYAGESSPERSAQNYITAVRIAYNTLLSHTPYGRVYVAIDNNWNVSNLNARDFLATIAGMADNGGDFYWQVSVEANASDASLSAIWTDSLVGDLPSFISPANIEVLSNLLATGQYTCNYMKRNILLNRFAVGGTDEEARAASYAYAFYKCLDAASVDGLIYAKHTDSPQGGVTDGLYTAPTASNRSERKLIADIISSIDNLADGQVKSVGSVIGSQWDTLYGNHRSKTEKRDLTIVGQSAQHSGKDHVMIMDFSSGNSFGFNGVSSEYSGLHHSKELGYPVFYAKLTPESTSDSAGAISGTLKLEDVKDAGFIGITSMITASGTVEADVTVIITGRTGKGVEKVFMGTGRVPAGVWADSFYNITDFLKDVKSEELSIAILTTPTSAGGSVNGLWMSQITTAAPLSNGFPFWIIFVIIGVIAAAGIVVFIIWFRKNYTIVRD